MDFKMNAVIHRGNNYNNALRSFQHKRMEFLEQEIRALNSETLWLLLRQLCKTVAHWKASPGWLYNEKIGGLVL
ncbi:hypothetical protein H6A12_05595 [Phocea massiliensis]|uniref:Uncharacterized protein n=1 Tax=Merdimmobilis hominis TaxID=2897707 RepID=A0A938X698_9FIRM|nr:hypothetical protein [Merdimmobilis hominis]MBM6920630.1 hypothetical protein [Merdimmobilis hominis]